MALPASIDPTAPANSDSPGQSDDQIRALKLFLSDVFGLPTSPTNMTAALLSIAAGGYLNLGAVGAPALKIGGATTGLWSAGAATDLNFSIAGTNVLALIITDPGYFSFDGVSAGVSGPILQLRHLSASPADGDNGGVLKFISKDDTMVERGICLIYAQHDDVSSATMDSTIYFSVQNNANGVDANTLAALSSLGVWTDASDEAKKEYEGDISDVTSKVKALTTLGVYHGKNTPADKIATAERHYSPTAQDFFSVFCLGSNPTKGHKGIAPKDVAWLAVKLGLEIEARVAALEARMAVIEARVAALEAGK